MIYLFNRFRNGSVLAEDTETVAQSEEQARENVRRRYGYLPSCRNDEYRIVSARPDEEPTP